MAKYKKRKDGRYATSVYLGNKRYYIYGKSVSELEKNKRQLIIDYELGLTLRSKEVLFKDYKLVWFDAKKTND